MDITINGKTINTEGQTTLAALIHKKCPNPNCVIAEVNEKIVKRESWETFFLKGGDCIELVTLVGGG